MCGGRQAAGTWYLAPEGWQKRDQRALIFHLISTIAYEGARHGSRLERHMTAMELRYFYSTLLHDVPRMAHMAERHIERRGRLSTTNITAARIVLVLVLSMSNFLLYASLEWVAAGPRLPNLSRRSTPQVGRLSGTRRSACHSLPLQEVTSYDCSMSRPFPATSGHQAATRLNSVQEESNDASVQSFDQLCALAAGEMVDSRMQEQDPVPEALGAGPFRSATAQHRKTRVRPCKVCSS